MPAALATPFGILAGCAADTHTFVDPTAWSGGEYQDFEPSSAGVSTDAKRGPHRKRNSNVDFGLVMMMSYVVSLR